MAEVTAQLVKQLRERTGAGMMECKNALVEANGNLDEAEVILRKRGAAAAAKKSTRSAKQGLIAIEIAPDAKSAVIVEVNCESDFVARTDDFQSLAADIASQVAASQAETVEALLAEPFVKDSATTVGDYIKTKIAKVGENIVVQRFERLAIDSGAITSYTHPGSQLAVAIVLKTNGEATHEEFLALGKDLAMQVAAADPKYVRRDQVDQAHLAKEADIARDRARNEGKPDKILDKIVEGRLSKFYEEVCLIEQPFIKDNSLTVTELVKQKGSVVGGAIEVAHFVRFKVGETQSGEEAAAE
ncbi:translation elongation factor Ts [Bryobacter aggregatus]|uniref:translation elongation factor Ts n=1 Tax=Bryobacter aggregatus TaxID=360054 RepID=UPI0004E1C027|nr:translation elongation factor Ts [Bryobacter aggregatus]